MKSLKKTASIVVASAMLLSLTGCDKANDQVLEAVDSYAAAVKDGKFDKIEKKSTDIKDSEAEDIQDLISFADYSGNKYAIFEAIKGTITYTVDEDSVDASSKSEDGVVDVVFTMADYESLFEEGFNSVDDLIDAIEDAEETIDVKVTVEFELDGEDWLVSNTAEVVDEVYSFVYADIPSFVNPDDFSPNWYGGDWEGNYNNVSSIDMDVSYTGSLSEIMDEMYYTVELDGELLYTSSTGTYEGYYNEAHGATLNEDGYLEEGDYVITFFVGDTQVLQGTAHVTVEVFEVNPDDFSCTIWFDDYDNEGTYTDKDEIDVDLNLPSGASSSDVYYTVEYNGRLVYTSDLGEREGYYGEDQGAELNEDGYLPSGTYVISFYYEDTFVLSQEITVVLSSEPTANGGDMVYEDDVQAFFDANLYESAIDYGWWDYDGTMTDIDTYGADTEVLAYSVEVGDDYTCSGLTYTYYLYDENAEASESVVFTSDLDVTSYQDGTHFLNFDCPVDGLEAGRYLMAVTDANDNILLMAICYYEPA